MTELTRLVAHRVVAATPDDLDALYGHVPHMDPSTLSRYRSICLDHGRTDLVVASVGTTGVRANEACWLAHQLGHGPAAVAVLDAAPADKLFCEAVVDYKDSWIMWHAAARLDSIDDIDACFEYAAAPWAMTRDKNQMPAPPAVLEFLAAARLRRSTGHHPQHSWAFLAASARWQPVYAARLIECGGFDFLANPYASAAEATDLIEHLCVNPDIDETVRQQVLEGVDSRFPWLIDERVARRDTTAQWCAEHRRAFYDDGTCGALTYDDIDAEASKHFDGARVAVLAAQRLCDDDTFLPQALSSSWKHLRRAVLRETERRGDLDAEQHAAVMETCAQPGEYPRVIGSHNNPAAVINAWIRSSPATLRYQKLGVLCDLGMLDDEVLDALDVDSVATASTDLMGEKLMRRIGEWLSRRVAVTDLAKFAELGSGLSVYDALDVTAAVASGQHSAGDMTVTV